MKIRIKFTKHGSLRYIGHLDLMRFFQKALRRSGIDIAFTQGFSPHPIMTFASPLGVGLESDGEYLDVVLNSKENCDVIKEQLNLQMVEGMEILSVTELPDNAQNAMASVAAAGYYVLFKDGFIPQEGWNDIIKDFMNKNEIIINKQTKKNNLKINIRPAIYDLRQSSYMEKDVLYLLINASSSGNIKPLPVIRALFENFQMELDEKNLMIVREDTYLNNGTPLNPEFLPMDAIGERTEV